MSKASWEGLLYKDSEDSTYCQYSQQMVALMYHLVHHTEDSNELILSFQSMQSLKTQKADDICSRLHGPMYLEIHHVAHFYP